jgi:hypothetical protein
MLTQQQLEVGFGVYFDEIHRCQVNKCYWALLHLVIILPDICGALESEDGQAKGERYKDWCKRHLAEQTLSEEEWYDIRCVVLHQGRTLASKGRYRAYSFSQPNEQGVRAHRIITDRNGILEINLDVAEMTKEILAAMQGWFCELLADPNAPRARNVDANLPSLANVSPRGNETIQGLTIRQTLPIRLTTSSP